MPSLIILYDSHLVGRMSGLTGSEKLVEAAGVYFEGEGGKMRCTLESYMAAPNTLKLGPAASSASQ